MPNPDSPINDLPVDPPQDAPEPAPRQRRMPAHRMRPSRRHKSKLAPTPSRYPVQEKSAEAVSPRIIEALKRKGWTVRQSS